MISTELIAHISDLMNASVSYVRPVSGGDISTVSLLSTEKRSFIIKINSAPIAEAMFKAEKKGLDTIKQTETIATPRTYACDVFEGNAFLLMEYIETKSPSPQDLNIFGEQLASLHSITAADYGLSHDNFIGRLDQSNTNHAKWSDFYIRERLIPQFKVSRNRSLLSSDEIPSEQILEQRCFDLFQNVKPSLLHGDLWNGNYIISTDGVPYLIDPAIYYGHHEVDIAMSRLFGGFGNEFYKAYHKHYPVSNATEDRIQLFQLYYLLVHLNMFGSSYYGSVKRILKAYF